MRKMGIGVFVSLFIVLSVFFTIWVITPDWLEAHSFTCIVLFTTFGIALMFSLICFITRSLWQGYLVFLYFLMMDYCMSLYIISDEKPMLLGTWVSIISSLAFCCAAYYRFKKEKELEKETNTQETNEINTEVVPINLPRFNHPDFDLVLETMQEDITFLQQHQSVIGIEPLHKVEKLQDDLMKMAVHYNQLRSEQRQHAEISIEELCLYAETLVEELKEKIDAIHLTQIKKLAYKHTK